MRVSIATIHNQKTAGAEVRIVEVVAARHRFAQELAEKVLWKIEIRAIPSSSGCNCTVSPRIPCHFPGRWAVLVVKQHVSPNSSDVCRENSLDSLTRSLPAELISRILGIILKFPGLRQKYSLQNSLHQGI